ncbi:MAG: sigma-70 family RNA polymerase sigma factor [Planctomycetes bacterium]|nr:sigma-70 family RNA polymerase sigma factor [Planctomycetota bacterium]
MTDRERHDAEALLDHMSWVHGLARSLVGEDRADDLAQEAMLAAMESPPQHGGGRGWLATVLRRRAASTFRSDSRRRRREERCARAESIPSEESVLERAELQQALVNAVMELRDPYRRILLLRFFEGLTPTEIAEQRETTSATIRSQLKRALEVLREQLDRRFGSRIGWTAVLIAFVALPPRKVVAAAATTTATTSVGTSLIGSLALGGTVMSFKSVAAAVVIGAAIVGGAIFFIQRDTTERDLTRSTSSASESAVRGPGEAPASTALARPTDGTASTTEEEAPPAAIDTVDTGMIAGTVTDLEGQPLEGIVVHAFRGEVPKLSASEEPEFFALRVVSTFVGGADRFPPLDDPKWRGVTDPSGRYEIPGIEPGAYSIVARGGGYQQRVLDGIEVAAERTAAGDFQLELGLAIEGTVFGPAGQPIAGAIVRSSGRGGMGDVGLLISGQAGSSPPQGVVSAETDAAGHFRLEGLKSGNHRLVASHPDFAESKGSSTAAGSREIELTLRAGVTITGKVFGPDQQPIADAEVLASSFGVEGLASRTVRTDAYGVYRFERLAPGRQRLTAQHPDFPSAQGERLTTEDGEVLEGVDIAFDAGAVVEGVVLDPAGAPLSGASVTVRSADRREAMRIAVSGFGGSRSKVGMTDAEGRFSIAGLRVDESRVLRATHPQYLMAEIDVTPGAGVTDVGTLQLARGATVRGVVLDADRGEPVARAQVRLSEAREGGDNLEMQILADMGGEFAMLSGGKSYSATTDDEGRYEILAVEAGEFRLHTRAQGHAPYQSDPFGVSGDDVIEREVRLGGGLGISGVVFDTADRPVVGALVEVSRFEPPSVFFRASAKTDEEGRFRLSGLDPANYTVKASSGNLAPAVMDEVAAGEGDVRLVLAERAVVSGIVIDQATGQPVPEFTVKAERSVSVSDHGSFDFNDLDFGPGSRFKDPGGRFVLKDLAPGKVVLRVTAEGFVVSEQELEVRAGESQELEIVLDIGGAVDGYVRDSDGKPVPGVVVQRVRKTGSSMVTARVSVVADGDGESVSSFSLGSDPGSNEKTDENGYFLLSGLPVGDVDLEFSSSDWIDQVIEKVSVARGVTRRLPPLELLRGATIRGRVLAEDGSPVKQGGVIIRLVGDEGGKPQWTPIDASGEFEQNGLAAGTYEVQVHRWKGSTEGGMPEPPDQVTTEVTLDPEEVESVTLRFE